MDTGAVLSPLRAGLCMSSNPCSSSPKIWLRKQASQRYRASQHLHPLLDFILLLTVSRLDATHVLTSPLKMPLLGSPIASHPRKMEQNPDEIIAKFEELSVLESEFDDVELEISM